MILVVAHRLVRMWLSPNCNGGGIPNKMIKIVNALPPHSDKNTYYLKNGKYWSYEDDNWILQSPWMARYIAQTDE